MFFFFLFVCLSVFVSAPCERSQPTVHRCMWWCRGLGRGQLTNSFLGFFFYFLGWAPGG
eukprot:SAG25_NODE_1421_length_3068_cov_1.145504_4_plen_58_part_01